MGLVAPRKPWIKGVHDTHACFVMEVRVVTDKQGDTWSAHELQEPEDEEIVTTLSSGGIEQAAHALLCEAIKRETLLSILVKASHDPAFKEEIRDPDPDTVKRLSDGVVNAILGTFQQAILHLGPDAARSALDMMRREMNEQDTQPGPDDV
jgi:hypothetical protein